jgi:ribosomal protein L16/L10AE
MAHKICKELEIKQRNITPQIPQNFAEALRLAANKLSVKCKFVKRETEVGGDSDED